MDCTLGSGLFDRDLRFAKNNTNIKARMARAPPTEPTTTPAMVPELIPELSLLFADERLSAADVEVAFVAAGIVTVLTTPESVVTATDSPVVVAAVVSDDEEVWKRSVLFNIISIETWQVIAHFSDRSSHGTVDSNTVNKLVRCARQRTIRETFSHGRLACLASRDIGSAQITTQRLRTSGKGLY